MGQATLNLLVPVCHDAELKSARVRLSPVATSSPKRHKTVTGLGLKPDGGDPSCVFRSPERYLGATG